MAESRGGDEDQDDRPVFLGPGWCLRGVHLCPSAGQPAQLLLCPAGKEPGHSQEHRAGGLPGVLRVMRRPLMRVDHGERPKCCSLNIASLGPILALAGPGRGMKSAEGPEVVQGLTESCHASPLS